MKSYLPIFSKCFLYVNSNDIEKLNFLITNLNFLAMMVHIETTILKFMYEIYPNPIRVPFIYFPLIAGLEVCFIFAYSCSILH